MGAELRRVVAARLLQESRSLQVSGTFTVDGSVVGIPGVRWQAAVAVEARRPFDCSHGSQVKFSFHFYYILFLRCFKEQYMFTHLPTCNTPELRYFYMHKYVCDTLENILLKYYFFFSFFSVHWTCQLAVSCYLPLTLNLTRWVQVSIQSKWVVRYRACFWKYKNMTKYELEYGFEKKNVWK